MDISSFPQRSAPSSEIQALPARAAHVDAQPLQPHPNPCPADPTPNSCIAAPPVSADASRAVSRQRCPRSQPALSPQTTITTIPQADHRAGPSLTRVGSATLTPHAAQGPSPSLTRVGATSPNTRAESGQISAVPASDTTPAKRSRADLRSSSESSSSSSSRPLAKAQDPPKLFLDLFAGQHAPLTWAMHGEHAL